MPKAQKSKPQAPPVGSPQYSKGKNPATHLNDYIRYLKAQHPTLSSNQYLTRIHRCISRIHKKRGAVPQQIIKKTSLKFKICKSCDKWAVNSKRMVECGLCEDQFHLQCAKDYHGEGEEWKCESCVTVWTKKDQLVKHL
jgi:hypothetical protein